MTTVIRVMLIVALMGALILTDRAHAAGDDHLSMPGDSYDCNILAELARAVREDDAGWLGIEPIVLATDNRYLIDTLIGVWLDNEEPRVAYRKVYLRCMEKAGWARLEVQA